MKKTFCKSFILLVLTTFMLSAFVGCSNKNTVVNSEAKLEKIYTNIDELVNDSTEIIEADVIDTKTIYYDSMPFTISNVQIQSCLKSSNLKVGDKLDVIETGGLFKDGKEYRFNGVSVMKKSEHVFLFIEPYNGPIAKDTYVIKGSYQGKFLIDNDKVKAPEADSKIANYIKDFTRESFKAKVSEILNSGKPIT